MIPQRGTDYFSDEDLREAYRAMKAKARRDEMRRRNRRDSTRFVFIGLVTVSACFYWWVR